jgi:hypothetical protein
MEFEFSRYRIPNSWCLLEVGQRGDLGMWNYLAMAQRWCIYRVFSGFHMSLRNTSTSHYCLEALSMYIKALWAGYHKITGKMWTPVPYPRPPDNQDLWIADWGLGFHICNNLFKWFLNTSKFEENKWDCRHKVQGRTEEGEKELKLESFYLKSYWRMIISANRGFKDNCIFNCN